ncbi:MAG: thioesterase family protein [Nitriliruptorales bacterium]|nr:thioesterase family protein [Nitriliruptorales bacterium]
MDAFFEPLGDGRYRSTELTRGPWDPDSQHAGPSTALLGGLLEETLGAPLARLTSEILRPVPITELTVEVEVLRPGRRVQLGQGTVSDDEGPLLLARAWALRTDEFELPEHVRPEPAGLPPPDECETAPFFVDWTGYHDAMEVRFVAGSFLDPGPATAWMRARVPIVEGQEISPLERVIVAADSGNGLSAALDFRQWLFINTDLTVHLHRQPSGEWVCLDTRTVAEPHGVGLATSDISDQQGPLGHGLQTLLVAPR